jgi:HAD superfamily hydrolase (TIGR01549 family)
MRKAVFFDLDGTLLPLDMERFTKSYFELVQRSGFLDVFGKDGQKVFGSGIYAILNNDGAMLNRDIFLKVVTGATGTAAAVILKHMDTFYADEFSKIRSCSRSDERAIETVQILKEKGYRLILSTNPIFPSAATDMRIEWAGLSPDDFEYVSYYDNSHYCKPNLEYFKEILDHTGLKASDCYVVGNDVLEDMSAVSLGFEGYLVLDNMIGDLGKVPPCVQGNYSDLLSFAKKLPPV